VVGHWRCYLFFGAESGEIPCRSILQICTAAQGRRPFVVDPEGNISGHKQTNIGLDTAATPPHPLSIFSHVCAAFSVTCASQRFPLRSGRCRARSFRWFTGGGVGPHKRRTERASGNVGQLTRRLQNGWRKQTQVAVPSNVVEHLSSTPRHCASTVRLFAERKPHKPEPRDAGSFLFRNCLLKLKKQMSCRFSVAG
jgi:hypothetical protein